MTLEPRDPHPPEDALGAPVDGGNDLDGVTALDDDVVGDVELETELDAAPVVARRRRFARWRSPAKRQGLPLRIALGGAVVFVVGLVITAGAKSYRDLQIVRQREAELAVRITASEERLEELHHRLELLRDDPATLERLAREELGLVGKDDLVFVLPAEP
jgi:cell division protein FtsB